VLALASSPTYDPNLIEKDFARVNRVRGECRGASALYDRATQGLYPPGSTFKVVTASAALDSGRFTPDSRFVDPGYCMEYGKQVRNAGNPEAPETFGNVDFSYALQHSINSVFCNIGKTLGAGKVLDYAKRYGFYSRPPLDTPPDERAPSGLYKNGRLFDPKQPQFQVDPGRLAFGQERLLTTPLQMAVVAATVGNHGVMMKPHLVSRIVAPDGSTVRKIRPERLGRVIKRQTADELTAMMVRAVEAGTGTAAQIPGIKVAGKTGTAETGRGDIYTAWFICFAPADNPRYAVAVVLEDQKGGFGGKVSAPIAKAILQALLPQPRK
jgi:peptidoglycan glycosyltransferase